MAEFNEYLHNVLSSFEIGVPLVKAVSPEVFIGMLADVMVHNLLFVYNFSPIDLHSTAIHEFIADSGMSAILENLGYQGAIKELQKQLQELRDRMAKASSEEKQIIKAKIEREDEKIKIERALLEFKSKQGHHLEGFNNLLRAAVEHISHSPYPYDAKPYLDKARIVLKDIFAPLKEMKSLEERLVQLTKEERALLKKERQAA